MKEIQDAPGLNSCGGGDFGGEGGEPEREQGQYPLAPSNRALRHYMNDSRPR